MELRMLPLSPSSTSAAVQYSHFSYVKNLVSCFPPVTALSLCSSSQIKFLQENVKSQLEREAPICSLHLSSAASYPCPLGFFIPNTLEKLLLPKLVMAFILSRACPCLLWPQWRIQHQGEQSCSWSTHFLDFQAPPSLGPSPHGVCSFGLPFLTILSSSSLTLGHWPPSPPALCFP